MKLRNFFDQLYESLISGDQYTRLKTSTIQMLVTAIGRFESRNIELNNEIMKNQTIMEERVYSIFKTLESTAQALEPAERKRLNQEIVKELMSKYEPETMDVVLEVGGLKRYK